MELATLAQIGMVGVGSALSGYALWRYGWMKKRGLTPTSLLAQESELAARFGKKPLEASVRFGKIKVPADTHFLAVGDTEAQLASMGSFFRDRRAAGDTLLVLDLQGMALERYFDESSDFILNGKDARSVSWTPFSEVSETWQVEGLVNAILASHDREGVQAASVEGAKLLCSVIILHLMSKRDLTMESFITLALGASLKELQTKLTDARAHALLHTPVSFVAARGVLADAINEYMTVRQKGLSFSLTEMLKAQHNGALFVTYDGDEGSKALTLCVLHQVLTTLMNLRGKLDSNHKIWVIVPQAEGLISARVMEHMMLQGRSINCFGVLGVPALSCLPSAAYLSTTGCLVHPGNVDEANASVLAKLGGFQSDEAACMQVLGALPKQHGAILLRHGGETHLGLYGTSPLPEEVTVPFELRDMVSEPYLAPKIIFYESSEDVELPAQTDLLQGMGVVKQLTPDEAFLKKMPAGSRILLRMEDIVNVTV